MTASGGAELGVGGIEQTGKGLIMDMDHSVAIAGGR